MAWWDAQHRSPGASSPRSRPRLIMGDAFPRLESKHIEMERERALLSPVFEDYLGPPTTPALAVHVEIRFTDPVIRSRYCRSYGSSPSFEPTDRICRGLVRRIERCSEEFVTRKDSGALEVFKDGSYERKPQRFEMTFRVLRRSKGEWAERTYRSYQKQPLTVAFTKEVILASHRMVGLFLRRHDQHFQWLDSPVSDSDFDGETRAPSRNGHPSLLSVPRSRFVEATQAFEFVPGYSIELCFRSRSPQRKTPTCERRLKVNSAQTTPLTLFMSEDLLWKALQAINQELDLKKRDFEDHVRDHPDGPHSDDDAHEIDLKLSNNLGPVYSHMQRNIRSKLALFRDPEARDCNDFLTSIENFLGRLRNEADAKINAAEDFEFRILELKGVGWTLREPAKFTIGSTASYGRRTIQAALDRIQTGIGDVIRGHNIAIHINAHKRGHLVLDKAIVAHEKRGKPRETFASHEEAETTFVSRLKARIQKDLDKVFEDSCSIDDIPEDEQEYFVRPSTPIRPEQPLSEGASSPLWSPARPEQAMSEGVPSPLWSPLSTRSSPGKRPSKAASRVQDLPRPRAQRVFSLSRRSTESMRSIDYLKAAESPFANDNSRPSTAASEQHNSPLLGSPTIVAEVRPARRSFSLVSRRPSSAIRVSDASTLVEELAENSDDLKPNEQYHRETGVVKEKSEGTDSRESMTSKQEEVSPAGAQSGTLPAQALLLNLDASLTSNSGQPPERLSQDDNKAALLASRETKQRNMDSPDTFEDAREFVLTPLPEGKAQPELSSVLGSPRSDDEFSTAPSTPELSTGGSSPRHSILATPVFLRADSGPVVLGSYPESEPATPAAELQVEITATPAPKENLGRAATDEHPIGQPGLSPPPEATPVPEPAIKGVDNAPVDTPVESLETESQGVTEISDPGARLVLPQETSDNDQTSTLIPSITSDLSPALSADKPAALERQVLSDELGAEIKEAPDVPPPCPDFPTPGVRESDPNKGPGHGSVFEGPGIGLDPGNRLEIPFESHFSEAPGNQLGTVSGAEAKPVEENVSSDVSPDAQEAPPSGDLDQEHGAEPEAVPSDSNAASETDIHETEVSSGDDDQEATVKTEVPTKDAGPDTTDDTGHTGSDGDADGPGLITEEQEKECPAAEDVTPDVGPVKETEDISSDVDIDARASEIALEKQPEETAGPGSEAEVPCIEPEGHVLDTSAETVEENRPITEVGVEPETDLSGPVEVPDSVPEKPEQQLDGQFTAPTVPGPEKGVDLLVQGGTVADESELCVENAGDEDAVGSSSRDVAPGLGDEEVSDGEEAREELISGPTTADAAEVETPEEEVTEEASGQSTEVPAFAEVAAGAEVPEQDVAPELGDEEVSGEEGLQEESIAAPTFAEVVAGAEVPEQAAASETGDEEVSAEEGIEEESFAAPTFAEVVAEAEVPEHVVAPELGDEEASDGEESIAVPTFAEVVAGVEVPEQGATEKAADVVGDSTGSSGTKSGTATGVGPDVRSGVLVEDLVDELEVRPNDELKGVSGSEEEAMELDTVAGPGVCSQVLEEDLADEFEVQPDDDGKDVSGSGNEVLASDTDARSNACSEVPEKDLTAELEDRADDDVDVPGIEKDTLELSQQGVETHGPGQELANATPESEAKAPESNVVDKVAQELEVQSDDGGDDGSRELDGEAQPQVEVAVATESGIKAPEHNIVDGSAQEVEARSDDVGGEESHEFDAEAQPQVEATTAAQRSSDDKKSEPEAESVETDNILGDEGDKVEIKEEVSTSDILRPQFREAEPVVAPAISVEDFTPPDVSAPSAEADLPASTTTTPTELLPSEPPTPVPTPAPEAPKEEKEKPHLAPIPDLTKLLSPTADDSASFTTSTSTRTSVDTYRPSTDEPRHAPMPITLNETPRTHCPQTAGYLGLRESRFVEIGLRGALGDTRHRRLSLPLQHLSLNQEAMLDGGRPSAPASEAGGSRKGRRSRGLKGGAADTGGQVGDEGGGGDAVLPKMVMLFAGAVALGRLMRRGE